jgi:hypothetical protein
VLVADRLRSLGVALLLVGVLHRRRCRCRSRGRLSGVASAIALPVEVGLRMQLGVARDTEDEERGWNRARRMWRCWTRSPRAS